MNLESNSKKILGIIVGFDEDDAIQQALSIYQGSKFINMSKIISWKEFKSYFVTDFWPEEYQENELGYFDAEDCYEAALFVRDLISDVLDKQYSLKIEMSAN